MNLLTKKIEEQLTAAWKKHGPDANLGDQRSIPIEDREIVVKYFNPVGAGTWYIVDGYYNEDAEDWILFGWADLGDPQSAELGYVSLNELKSFKGMFGLGIERDLYFGQRKLGDVVPELIQDGAERQRRARA